MPQYLVGYSDSEFKVQDFVIAHADNETQAAEKFARVEALRDPNFLGYVYGKAVNASFAENFWLHTDEEQDVWNEKAEVTAGYDDFERRVREFFGERSDFAEAYLNFYDEDNGDELPHDWFSDEMLQYIWLHDDWASLTVLPLDNIEQID